MAATENPRDGEDNLFSSKTHKPSAATVSTFRMPLRVLAIRVLSHLCTYLIYLSVYLSIYVSICVDLRVYI